MQPIATDVARIVVCHSLYVDVSVCVSRTRLSCAKVAEPIKMPFGGVIVWVQENIMVASRSTHRRSTIEEGHVLMR